jgi:hypothetical protein
MGRRIGIVAQQVRLVHALRIPVQPRMPAAAL